MLNEATWWQMAALAVALLGVAALYFGRGRLPWWASGVAGALVALGGYIALFTRKAPNSPTAPPRGGGLDVGASAPHPTQQRPNEALEEIEHEATKLDDVGAAVRPLDSADDELDAFRRGAGRDGL